MITMKKSYITPATVVVNVAPTTALLQLSVTLSSTEYVDAAEVEVKGNVHHYDVWEDDWSADEE